MFAFRKFSSVKWNSLYMLIALYCVMSSHRKGIVTYYCKIYNHRKFLEVGRFQFKGKKYEFLSTNHRAAFNLSVEQVKRHMFSEFLFDCMHWPTDTASRASILRLRQLSRIVEKLVLYSNETFMMAIALSPLWIYTSHALIKSSIDWPVAYTGIKIQLNWFKPQYICIYTKILDELWS